MNQPIEDVDLHNAFRTVAYCCLNQARDVMSNLLADREFCPPTKENLIDQAHDILFTVAPDIADFPSELTAAHPIRAGESSFEYMIRLYMISELQKSSELSKIKVTYRLD